MSFYNGVLNSDDVHGSGVQGPKGDKGDKGGKDDKGDGYKLDANGNYNIENKKIINVKAGTNNNDVVIKEQIQYLDGVNPGEVKNNKAVIYSNTGSIHSNALYLKDQYEQEVNFHTEDQDDNQIRLYIPNLKNYDSYGGRRKSSIMVTSINQRIEGKKIFDDIEVSPPILDNHAASKVYVDHNFLNRLTGGQIGGDLDMRGHIIKYLKYDKSDDAAARVAELNLKLDRTGGVINGDLVLQRKYQYPILGDLKKVINYENIREIFLSRKESFPMNVDLNMNNHLIQNVKDPINADNGVNKKYVDDKVNTKANISDLGDYFKLDGSKSMTGNINMNNNRILSLPSPIQDSEATNKEYISKNYLDIHGDNHMDGNIRMNGNRILGLSEMPKNNYEAPNKIYVDNSINKAQIKPSHVPQNALKYIMDDIDQTSSEYGIEIDKIDNLEASFHSYNKRVIYLKLLKDENDYDSRIGYNIYQLVDKSKDRLYTAVIEWLTTDNNAWTKMEIHNNITSGSILSNQTKKFEDGNGVYYTRSVIQFKVLSITTPPVYLLSSININGVNPTYPVKFSEVYNIIYGCSGKLNHIDPDMIYDKHNAFQIDKNRMKMLVNLDMNNKAIMNVKTPLSNLDAANKLYVDDSIKPFEKPTHIYMHGMVDRNKIFTISSMQLSGVNLEILYIRFNISTKYKGMSDSINIKSAGLSNVSSYSFNFSSIFGFTIVNINQYFNFIEKINMDNAKNIPFQLVYKVFYTSPYA